MATDQTRLHDTVTKLLAAANTNLGRAGNAMDRINGDDVCDPVIARIWDAVSFQQTALSQLVEAVETLGLAQLRATNDAGDIVKAVADALRQAADLVGEAT